MERKIRASRAHLAPHRGGREAAGGVFPRSAGRPSPRDCTVALGGPKAAPVGIAPAPLSFRALASRAKLFGANWPSTSSMFIARELRRMHCPLGRLGLRARQRARRPAPRRQTRLRPEIEGLRSDLSIRQHRQPPLAPGDPINVARTNWVACEWAAAVPEHFFRRGVE